MYPSKTYQSSPCKTGKTAAELLAELEREACLEIKKKKPGPKPKKGIFKYSLGAFLLGLCLLIYRAVHLKKSAHWNPRNLNISWKQNMELKFYNIRYWKPEIAKQQFTRFKFYIPILIDM